MNSYEAKQEARRARLEAAADRARREADAAFKRSDLREEVSGIPFGQPILVGHHSERRHRAAIERAHRAMDASVAASRRAKDLDARAAAVGSGGISADDPDAVEKLAAELASAIERRAFMVAANKIVRAAARAGVDSPEHPQFAGYLAKAQALQPGIRASALLSMLKPDFCGRIGFADFQLSNLGANIRRMQARLEQLQRQAEARAAADGEVKRTTYQGLCDVVEDLDENRLQIVFEGKPDAAIRDELKSRGFRWAPSQGAWQRQLNSAARWAAKEFLRSQGVET